MLQQTRVETVLDRYRLWLERFPDLDSLASADEHQVLEAWAGLGYYRRARNLHRAAILLAERGGWPEDAAGWRELPGIGDYTAGAIAAQTTGEAGAVVDGNVERVLSRLEGIEDDVRRREGRTQVREASRAILAAGPAGDVLQALMDLGATVCTPRNPSCLVCPWRDPCVARARGKVETIPRLPERRAPKDVHRVHLVVEHDGAFLLRRAQEHEYAAGLWIFPCTELLDEAPGRRAPSTLARKEGLRLVARSTKPLAAIHYGITHHRIHGHVFRARTNETALPEGYRRFSPQALADAGLARPDQKIARLLAEAE